jgi:hypothetical protein
MMVCEVVDETAPLWLRILPKLNTKFRPVEVARLVLADLTLKEVKQIHKGTVISTCSVSDPDPD